MIEVPSPERPKVVKNRDSSPDESPRPTDQPEVERRTRSLRRGKRSRQESKSREEDEHTADALFQNAEAEASLSEVLNQKSGPEQIRTLLALIARLLALRPIIHAEDNQGEGPSHSVRDERTEPRKAVVRRTLEPERVTHFDDTRDKQYEATGRIEFELAQGKTVQEIKQSREQQIAMADRTIDSADSATRDTALRRREDALFDLRSLELVSGMRLDKVTELNRYYDLSRLARAATAAPDLLAFADAKFGLDDRLTPVLKGLTPASVSRHRGGKLESTIPGASVSGNEDHLTIELGSTGYTTVLVFVRSTDGKSYILKSHD